MELKERVIKRIETVKVYVARVLFNNPEFREVDRGKDLVKRVWKTSHIEFSPETILRHRRKFHENGLFLPKDLDKKVELERIYRNHFRKNY